MARKKSASPRHAKPKRPAKLSELDLAVAKYRTTFATGRVLSIDPSSGSAGSQPGYSLCVAGNIVECGTLVVQPGVHEAKRYQQLLKALQELCARFPPDLLVIEKIALVFGGQKFFRQDGVIRLHRSIGVAMASHDFDRIVECAPASWHSWLRHQGLHDSYVKTDAHDSAVLLLTCFARAGLPVTMPDSLRKAMFSNAG